jgi:hypothetical protein
MMQQRPVAAAEGRFEHAADYQFVVTDGYQGVRGAYQVRCDISEQGQVAAAAVPPGGRREPVLVLACEPVS